MNGARTTFMRRGYLLTALAAVVLLAASPGTASAQQPAPSIGFVEEGGVVAEDASALPTTPAPLRVTLRVANLPDDDVTTATNERTAPLGTVAIAVPGELTAGGFPAGIAVGALESLFATSDTATFTVVPTPGGTAIDDDWVDERSSLVLTAGNTARVTNNLFAVTVDDDEVAPIAQFSRSGSVRVHEGNTVAVDMEVVEGAMRAGVPPGISAFSGAADLFRFTVDPPDAAGTTCAPPAGTPTPLVAITGANQAAAPNTNVFTSDTTLSAMGATPPVPEPLTIEACADAAEFSGATVTLAVDLMLDHTPGPANDPVETSGPITAGAELVLQLESDKAAPTLSFVPTDPPAIEEGGEVRAVLRAEGDAASEVMDVTLSVEGTALVDLYDGDTMLTEDENGRVSVSLGGSGSVALTAISMEDPDLFSGDAPKTKTWKLIEGETDGADIDANASWLTVTVSGTDDRPADPDPTTPTASFTSAAASIDEGSHGDVSIDVVDPDMVGLDAVTVSMEGAAMLSLHQGGSAIAAGAGGYYMVDPSMDLRISADPDEELMDGELKMATLEIMDVDAYDVGDTAMLEITVQGDSNVPTALPTVSFLQSSLSIDEGGMGKVHLERIGDFRDESGGSVTIAMEGDAMLTLMQDDSALAMGAMGAYTVDLSSGPNTTLTVVSESDPDLMDGYEKMATLMITGGTGAMPGDMAELMVTVTGSTAVPAIPLIGQLLLALFLMAGGARLYRRRQG